MTTATALVGELRPPPPLPPLPPSPGVTWGRGMTREASATQRVYERVARELGASLEAGR